MVENTSDRHEPSSSSSICLTKENKHAHNQISDAQLHELENLFLMDGITPYQAGKIVNVRYETTKRYFEQWAENLISDPEHETWAYRAKRVRARALEGFTKKIIEAKQQRVTLEKIAVNLMFKKCKDKKDGLELKDSRFIPHGVVLSYNNQIKELRQQEAEFQIQYDMIDASTPAEVILKQEILEALNEIQSGE